MGTRRQVRRQRSHQIRAFDILEEIETCKDPAHFESKVAARVAQQPDWLEKLAAEPPKPITPLQSVINDFKQMDAYLESQMSRTQNPPPFRSGRLAEPSWQEKPIRLPHLPPRLRRRFPPAGLSTHPHQVRQTATPQRTPRRPPPQEPIRLVRNRA